MKKVKINREELLKIVQENKEKHIEDFVEALDDYKEAVLVVAEENLLIARQGDVDDFKFKTFPGKPRSYEKDYNRSIRMLELSVDDEIELEQEVFNQLVLDEWTWKDAFTMSNSLYKSYLE